MAILDLQEVQRTLKCSFRSRLKVIKDFARLIFRGKAFHSREDVKVKGLLRKEKQMSGMRVSQKSNVISIYNTSGSPTASPA